MDFDLTNGLRPDRYRATPFPHYLVPDALPEQRYADLTASFPEDHRIRRGVAPGDNIRHSWPAVESLADPALPEPWRRFVSTLVSQDFLRSVLDAFGPAIRERYPLLEARLGPMAEWRVGLRGRDDFSVADVLLDAQICLNTPVLHGASSVRGPHLDKPNKLFAGLFYMRPDDDTDTRGGELLIQRRLDPHARFDGSQIAPTAVETVNSVPYAANMLVMFLNGTDAFHAVTPRQPTPRSRYFVNLIGEIPYPLFDIKSKQRSFRRIRRLAARVGDWVAGRRTHSGQLRD